MPEPAEAAALERRQVERFLSTRSEDDFRAFYRRHTPALYRVALRVVCDDNILAEEVIQETWIRAIQHLDRFEWRAALRTWLTGIALNCARESLRQEVRYATDALPEAGVASPTTDPIDTTDLHDAVAALPLGSRQIVVLHDIAGHTHEEIANMLGIAVGTSKSQLSRARQALRTCLSSRSRAASGTQSKEHPS